MQMTHEDDTSPATKEDLKRDLKTQKGAILEEVKVMIEESTKDLKTDIRGVYEYVVRNEQKMYEMKTEILHHFDLAVEILKHELLYGALHDKVELHEDRITRIEHHPVLQSYDA